jgi:hypothetical protein
MVHLRIVVPPALGEAEYRIVSRHPAALNVVRLPNAFQAVPGTSYVSAPILCH